MNLITKSNSSLLFAAVAGAFAVVLNPAHQVIADPPSAMQPNVVVIVSDDLGYNDLGIQGSKEIPTPNIDSIAQHGVRFTNAYVTGPLCGPSRAGIMSGRYQEQHSYDFMPGPDEGLSLKEATLGDAFQKAGYSTAVVGKWNLGSKSQFQPLHRGFDRFFGFLGALHAYIPGPVPDAIWMVGEHPRSGWGIPPNSINFEPAIRPSKAAATQSATTQATAKTEPTTKPAPGGKAGFIVRDDKEVAEKAYLTYAFTREAIRFIDQSKARPYFLYLAYNASHDPLQPPQKYLDRFPNLTGKRKLYAATTSALDDGVGQVLAEIRKLGQEKNTIILFINDNGGPITDTSADNTPLSGTKGSLWEGGIRVAFMAQWAGNFKENTTRDEIVSSLDIFPTLIAAAKVPIPSGKALDGVNLSPVLTGQPQPELANRTLYWRIGDQWAIRQGKWKLELPEIGSPKTLLFDLQADIGENADLLDKNAEIAKQMKEEWGKWNAKNLPLPPDYKAGQAKSLPRLLPFKDIVLFRDDDT